VMRFKIKTKTGDCITMPESYLAPARAPAQLDIIADTILRASENRTDLSTKALAKNRTDLSTNVKSENRTDLSTDRAKRIAARRKALGVSTSALAAAADLHLQTYFAAIRNPLSTRLSTFDALEGALDRFAGGITLPKRLTIYESRLFDLITQLAMRSGWDPELMLAQDFSSENTNDPVWLQASRLRRCAIYLMVEGMKCSKADIGRLIGVSRQAVHKSVAAIEAERDRSEIFHELMGSMMLQVKGQRL
jgi:DNA-binding XRE family transcriptional regulator